MARTVTEFPRVLSASTLKDEKVVNKVTPYWE